MGAQYRISPGRYGITQKHIMFGRAPCMSFFVQASSPAEGWKCDVGDGALIKRALQAFPGTGAGTSCLGERVAVLDRHGPAVAEFRSSR